MLRYVQVYLNFNNLPQHYSVYIKHIYNQTCFDSYRVPTLEGFESTFIISYDVFPKLMTSMNSNTYISIVVNNNIDMVFEHCFGFIYGSSNLLLSINGCLTVNKRYSYFTEPMLNLP